MFFWTIFKFILGIVLIAIVIYLLFFGPGKELLKGIGLITTLPKEAEENGKKNFDIMIENIQKCAVMADTDCICEVFPSWPGSFPKNSQLEIEIAGKDTRINWTVDKTTFKNATLNNLKISAIILPEFEGEIEEKDASRKIIYFGENQFPEFQQEGLKQGLWPKQYWPKLVSNALYKGFNSNNPNTLHLIVAVRNWELKLQAFRKCEK